MSYTNLLQRLGFEADPFAKTNADEEDHLKSYFIEPPFFKAVYGDLSSPKSAVVFAPRGGGKTALKRMLELSSQTDPFLCVTYNHFATDGLRLQDIGLDYHLRNIARLLLVAVLSAASERDVNMLTPDDRHLLYLFTKAYLSEIDTSELKAAIQAVQNFSDKAKEWWNAFTGPLGVVINSLLTKVGLGTTEIEKFASSGGKLGHTSEQIAVLGQMALKLGYQCVYVLIDKVDENALTGKASTSFQFIQSLLSDLQILELQSFGFKFFLWDMLLENYREVARPDRVKYYGLKWDLKQLREMLSRRLAAHSANKVTTLTSISDVDARGDVDSIVVLFAQGSPRNIIRICKEILDQQSELDSSSDRISAEAVIRGFEVFARNYTNEILPEGSVRDLQKVKRADFTVKYVYNEIFKFSQQAGISKVKSWQDLGVVDQIGVIQETRGVRSSNHYGLTNPLVLKYMFPELNVFELWDRKMRICECGTLLLRDWDINGKQTCHGCQRAIAL
jgi:hypothetical protein